MVKALNLQQSHVISQKKKTTVVALIIKTFLVLNYKLICCKNEYQGLNLQKPGIATS